jgi:predicted ATP-grasp superfamily ATP-dependent carboligase
VFVLLLGHRRGISKVLEHLHIPFVIWSPKVVKNKTQAQIVVHKEFPLDLSELKKSFNFDLKKLTHVITGTEEAVGAAAQIRAELNLPGVSQELAHLCTDKFLMKEYLSRFGVPLTEYMLANSKTNISKLFLEWGKPLIIKPRIGSGGKGILRINSESDIPKHCKTDEFLYEKFVNAKEGSIESIVVNGKIIFSNITEYYKLSHCNIVPGYQKSRNLIEDLNKKVISAMDIKNGFMHLEFYLKEDSIVFGEIAIRPPGGYILELLDLSYAKNFWEFYVKAQLQLTLTPTENFVQYSSAIIIHPGEGRVEKINGLERIKNLESFKKINLKLKPGQWISKRVGVGQDFGHILLAHPDLKVLSNDIDFILNEFKITLS